MPQVSISFRFSQRFNSPAREVYEWATDYDPEDFVRMGHSGKRKIARVCNETLILTDTFEGEDGAKITKKKLVRLDPAGLRWTNTHLTGPNQHSQFLYELIPEGESACRLDFAGMQILELEDASKRAVAACSRQLRREDSITWKNLARAFASERKQASRP